MTAARVAATLGDSVALVVADAGRSSAEVIADLRATRAGERESVLLLIRGDVAALDRAMLRAAIGPLAIELAPAKRLNAVDIGGNAADEDITAAARFLAAAGSTTGQIIDVR